MDTFSFFAYTFIEVIIMSPNNFSKENKNEISRASIRTPS